MTELTKDAKESILAIQVDAALAGHDLGPFEPVEVLPGGYEARCRNCNQSAWVGDSGLMYSLLGRSAQGLSRITLSLVASVEARKAKGMILR